MFLLLLLCLIIVLMLEYMATSLLGIDRWVIVNRIIELYSKRVF